MSEALVNQFLAELDRLKKASGSLNEQTIRPAFRDLLRSWCRSKDLILLEEHEFKTKLNTKVYPDGTIVHDLRVPLGYWEAKDTQDDLDAEIRDKLAKGYPTSNIIFENSQLAVLYQNGAEVRRASMLEPSDLSSLLARFFAYERPEIADFRRAVEQFKTDLPDVLTALREKIDAAYHDNDNFNADAKQFLDHAKNTINPAITEADIREMLIQHILTEEIFNHVFNEGDFHRENNIAKNLYDLERKFFRGAIKKDTLKALEPYYAAIRSAAASITAHVEKQKFLKVIYENFYKVYNPKAADRLGVVYTPNEIVRFMIDGADWLCRENFGKGLIDRGVDILDPCTGTGTFICELLETFRGNREKLAHKYKNELHANELAILPYYVANLNIEATYAAITGQYAEYPNLCFVDTLDNVAALGIRSGHQHDMFAALSDENIERVKRQNNKTISVIIGNPPYNANQQNENDNNKNRTYKRIDESIRSTYVARSTAQKTKVYDMYARFFRWASDRLGDDGIVAFITNRSFIDSRTFDGFRACVAEDYSEIWVVDLGGDVRANPKLSGPRHNVFAIQTGVCIAFMVRRTEAQKRNAKKTKEKPQAIIRYARRPEMEEAENKLLFLDNTPLSEMRVETITPSERGNWINQVENEWDDLIPIADKKTKAAKGKAQERAVFKLFSFGAVTNRDDWVYGRSEAEAIQKSNYLLARYEVERADIARQKALNATNAIKWTRSMKRRLQMNEKLDASNAITATVSYRPFDKRALFMYPPLIEMLNQQRVMFGEHGQRNNCAIAVTDPTSQKPWMSLASAHLIDMHFVGAAAGANCLPRHRYSPSSEKIDNITDWALNKFVTHYGKKTGITKDAIFNYCYAVLHDPVYRETYAINLKREFPRIPFYEDFHRWAAWGEALMGAHISYEEVEPWPVERQDVADPKRAEGTAPKVILKSIPPEDIADDTATGSIKIDADTTLTNIPTACWRYKLGNRTAIDWVLDQHKEKKPRDPTIREKFNTYRFADHKERVIDLLARVARVSVDTVAITEAMAEVERAEEKA
ncbi:MAG: type ISP restriction/modification enzyme [Pseudomonadota bacterium]